MIKIQTNDKNTIADLKKFVKYKNQSVDIENSHVL